MTESDADPLMGLFRREAAAAAAVLSEGLAVLAVDPDHPTEWEPLERAARSVRGAALIVGQSGAAELAGVVADVFAEARRDTRSVTGDRVAVLLSAVDLLKAVSDGDDSVQVSAVVDRLSGINRADVVTVDPAELSLVPDQSFLVTGEQSQEAPATPARSLEPPIKEGSAQDSVGAQPSLSPQSSVADAPLLELFREEVRSLTGTLSEGLVELEADPTDTRRIEPLMRAAHSIKGAARIVAVEPGVAVAHVMEELLVAAQAGTRTLTAADIDVLLGGVDLLAELADADLETWSTANVGRVAGCVAALRGRLEGKPVPTSPYESIQQVTEVSPPRVEARREPTSTIIPEPERTAEPSPPSLQTTASPPDQVVRVSAQSLSRLLSLAGESLVEARWLQPFARSLLKLKKYHDHLADMFDELARIAPGRVADDARKRLADCRETLADRIAAFEAHARDSDDLNSRLYREVIASRMRPFADGTHGLGRMARDVARALGKQVRFEVAGQDTDVDRDILDRLESPLGHIVRNAIDHGLETPDERTKAGKPEAGTIRVEARHHAGMLNIRVSDDGRGIDLDRLRARVIERRLTTPELAARMSEAELTDFLFLPGFSTASAVTDVSGRGVGLDVVQSTVQAVGGSVRLHSRPGQGTTFELHLPITLSVVRAVLVKIAGDPFALPLNRTDRLLRLPVDEVRTLEGKAHFESTLR